MLIALLSQVIQSPTATEMELLGSVLESPIDKDEYILGPGDSILVIINTYVNYSYPTKITPAGGILLMIPTGYQTRIGEMTLGGIRLLDLSAIAQVKVVDKSISEAEEIFKKELHIHAGKGDVKIVLLKPRKTKVFVLGNVSMPGVYTVTPFMRVSDVLNLAKPTQFASFHIEIIRNNDTSKINLKKFFFHGDLKNNPTLKGGEIINVPKMKRFVRVYGGVAPPYLMAMEEFHLSKAIDTLRVKAFRETWIYEIDPDETLQDFLKYTQGFHSEFEFENCYIQRGEKKIYFDFEDALNTDNGNIKLNHKDILVFPLKIAHIFVTGEVVNPKEILYSEGRTVNEYIGMAGGFLYTSDTKNIQIITSDGKIKKAKSHGSLKPGDIIFVPRRPIYSWREAIVFGASLLHLIASLRALGK